MKQFLPFALAALIGAIGPAAAQRTRPDNPVKVMKLPLELPAVGNFDAVRLWRFGRLQEVEQKAGPDLILSIRTGDGRVQRIVGPAAELAELARQSNWLTTTKSQPGRSDYVERMIAFDVDRNGRLIAMISLEPQKRDRKRLRRAIGL